MYNKLPILIIGIYLYNAYYRNSITQYLCRRTRIENVECGYLKMY